MPHRILVVDDEEAIRSLLRDYLEGRGYAVVTAHDGEQGLKALRESQPHLAIIDFLLPRKNGFALAEAIRSDAVSGRLPIIMTSGVFKNPKTAVEAREKYQVVDFLAKPIDMDRLVNLIRSSLQDVPEDEAEEEQGEDLVAAAARGNGVSGIAATLDQGMYGHDEGEPEDEEEQEEAQEEEPPPEEEEPEDDPPPRGLSYVSQPNKRASLPAALPAAARAPVKTNKREIVATNVRPFPPLLEDGPIEKYPVALLISMARYDKLTGMLDFSEAGIHRRVYLLKGQPIFMQSNAEGENVGALLLRRGRITEVDFERCLTYMKQKKRTLQQALLELRLATEQDLATAYKLLAGQLLPAAIGMPTGSFKWRETDAFVGRVPEGNFDAMGVIFEGIKKHVHPPTILAFFKGREDVALMKSSEFESLAPHFRRAFGAGHILGLINDKASYREITRARSADGSVVIPQLFALVASGMCIVPSVNEDNEMDVAVSGAVAEIQGIVRHEAEVDEGGEAPDNDSGEEDESQFSAAEKQARAKIQKAHRDFMGKSFFEMFGIEKSTVVDEAVVKDTYFKLARAWHPDQAFSGLRLGTVQPLLEEITQRINEGYETLTDKQKRSEYIVFIDRQAKGLPTDVNQILDAERIFDEGVAAMRRRDMQTAKKKFAAAVGMNPGEPLFVAHLGWATFATDQSSQSSLTEAVNLLKKAVDQQENLPIAYQFLGQICQQRGQNADAKKWFDKCLEWEPNNIEASRALRLINNRDEKDRQAKSGILSRFLKK